MDYTRRNLPFAGNARKDGNWILAYL